MGNTKRIKDEIIRRNVELKEQIDGWTKSLLIVFSPEIAVGLTELGYPLSVDCGVNMKEPRGDGKFDKMSGPGRYCTSFSDGISMVSQSVIRSLTPCNNSLVSFD
jgi:hypothetical protein